MAEKSLALPVMDRKYGHGFSRMLIGIMDTLPLLNLYDVVWI